MNTIYITSTGKVKLDENNIPSPIPSDRTAIDNMFYVKEDSKIVYNKGGETEEMDAKAGDIVIAFYESTFPHKIIVVNSNEWKDNLDAYAAYQQEQKEKWAASKGDCETCDICDNC